MNQDPTSCLGPHRSACVLTPSPKTAVKNRSAADLRILELKTKSREFVQIVTSRHQTTYVEASQHPFSKIAQTSRVAPILNYHQSRMFNNRYHNRDAFYSLSPW